MNLIRLKSSLMHTNVSGGDGVQKCNVLFFERVNYEVALP